MTSHAAPTGVTFRSTVTATGGAATGIPVPLSAAHRSAAGLAADDEVEVHLRPGDAPGAVEVPQDLAVAIAAAGLTERWDRLAPSHRKEHVRAVLEAKRPETRARRVSAAVTRIGGG